jgi:hypothetical protein
MVNKFLHDYDNVDSVIISLKAKKQDYEDKVAEIKTLITNIEGSSAWIDQTLKTSFINCCHQYLTLYDRVLSGLTSYIDRLEKKSKLFLELETTYARGA